MSQTILAVFDSLEHAQAAVSDLTASGYDRSDIGLAARDIGNRAEHYVKGEVDDDDVEGPEGAGFGALVGGLTGLVLGLTAITIPGIGAVIAAGPLAAVLGGATGAAIGATAGAVTGGVSASLIHLGVPDDQAEYYAESVRRGSALVSVTARDESSVSRATDILRRHYPVNVERRATQWKMKGWKGFDPAADPYTSVDLAENPPAEPEEMDTAVRTYNSPHV